MRAEDLARWFEEDLGPAGLPAGDVTTDAIVPAETRVEAALIIRERGVAAGLREASRIFEAAGATGFRALVEDGDDVPAEGVLARVEGPASAVLGAERLALNLVGRMMGIATLARALQRKAEAVNPACRVLATRKTTPGLRALEKRAVQLGGADPHRFGLHDAFLVKDNHRLVCPDVAEAVRRCRAHDPAKTVEVEVESLEDARRAAGAGADILLLDNRTPEVFAAWAAELRRDFPDVLLEASGGITPDNLEAYARHADRVSLGWLTHSVRCLDVGLDVQAVSGTPVSDSSTFIGESVNIPKSERRSYPR